MRHTLINPDDAQPLWSILAQSVAILENDPDEAVRHVNVVLKQAPGQQQALQILVSAHRVRGDLNGARTALESMATELPDIAAIHYELGLLQFEMGDAGAAAGSLSRVIVLEPRHPQAWRALGDALVQGGDAKGAADAYANQFASSVMDLKTLEQLTAVDSDQTEIAENVLREFLNAYPTDLMALRMLGQMHMRANQFESAEQIFARAVDLDPSFRSARHDYVSAFLKQMKWPEEIRELDILLQDEPGNPDYSYLKATALAASGRTQEAIRFCEDLIRAEPERGKFWLPYGFALRVAGRHEDCVAAFRKAIEFEPGLGDAWWGLANLMTFRFAPQDVDALRLELARENLGDDDRIFLHFALGKALEDVRSYEESFDHYSRGNAFLRAQNPYNVEEITENVQREKRRFTREMIFAQAEPGCPSAEPIFIIGMARSGSTLIEQILASHSSVEGCGEMPSLAAIVRKLEARRDDKQGSDADDAETLFRGEDLKALGEEYLERCRGYRSLSRPHFTDKMPTNFHHLGFICTMFPNARIIDVRRHPLACCLSNFKQIFPSKVGPSYDLTDIGLYYRDYIELMAHFERELPGRVHRVIYEDLLRSPELEIRRLLDYCGLPFEELCLRYYETDRDIRTISSEQVRRPLYSDSVEQWRHFEPWLAPLKSALGPVLDAYPAVPDPF